jgi:hypothetical protein
MKSKIDYAWLEDAMPKILFNLGKPPEVWLYASNSARLYAHICHDFRFPWENNDIPFNHGIALFLLSFFEPWLSNSHDAETGEYDPQMWVLANYNRFKEYFPPA